MDEACLLVTQSHRFLLYTIKIFQHSNNQITSTFGKEHVRLLHSILFSSFPAPLHQHWGYISWVREKRILVSTHVQRCICFGRINHLQLWISYRCGCCCVMLNYLVFNYLLEWGVSILCITLKGVLTENGENVLENGSGFSQQRWEHRKRWKNKTKNTANSDTCWLSLYFKNNKQDFTNHFKLNLYASLNRYIFFKIQNIKICCIWLTKRYNFDKPETPSPGNWFFHTWQLLYDSIADWWGVIFL